MAEEFDASPQSGLSINRQMMGVEKKNNFKIAFGFGLCIGFGEEFEFFSNKLDPFSVRTVDRHDVGLRFRLVFSVNPLYEFADQGQFAGPSRPVKYNVWNLLLSNELV